MSTSQQRTDAFEQSLQVLQKLAKVYDEGCSYISFLMAVEAQKLMHDSNAAVSDRNIKKFNGLVDYFDDSVLNTVNKLVIADFYDDTVVCLPAFYHYPSDRMTDMPFVRWWTKDVVYRASSAVPGSEPGMLPVNGSPEIAFAARESLTRRQLVKLLRDKLGAHRDHELPELLHQIQDLRYSWGFQVNTPKGVLSTYDGTLPVKVGPLPPMMRQIAHELLAAYGIDDPAPHPYVNGEALGILIGQMTISRREPPPGGFR